MAQLDTNGFGVGPRGSGQGGPLKGRGAGRRVAVDKLFDRPMPHAPEAEMSLLGSMIFDHRVIGDVVQAIPSGDAFYSEAHAAIFDALVHLYDKHQSGDLVQLAQALRDRGVLEAVGGPEFLLRLAQDVPSSAHAPHYARVVAEKHRLRRLIEAAGEILFDAFHAQEADPDGGQGVLDKAEQRIFEIADEAEQKDVEKLAELLHQAMDALEKNEGRAVTGLPTGFYDLDHLTSGFQQGELIIIAARPSMGKTALALNLAEQIAAGGGAHGAGKRPVAVFSMEMSRQSVAQRLLCAHSGVDSHLVRTNRLGEQHFRRLMDACGELAELPIFIDDTPGLTVLGLRARARRLVAQRHVECIFIDYLQLMSAPGSARESRQVEVSAISRGVKALARELKVPVVCLSQLNRGAEQREGNRPRMSDLRESGSIEQDADVVMLLHREEYYHQADPEWLDQNPDKVGLSELIIAKQRNGPTGSVPLTWNAAITRFQNHADSAWATQAPPTVQTRPAAGGSFATSNRPKTGPVAGHRDGGGPDAEAPFDSTDLPYV